MQTTNATDDPTPGTFNIAGSTFTDVQAVGYYFSNGTATANNAGFNISGFEVSGFAVPEPSSYSLIVGCFALGALALRRRHNS